MRPIRTLNSAGFRFAALFAVVFLGLSCALCAVSIWIVGSTQTAALVKANDADIGTVVNGLRDEGLREAVEVIGQLLGPPAAQHGPPPRVFILLRDRSRGKIVGNLDDFPPRVGPFAPAGDVLGQGADIADGLYLFVGRSTAEIASTRARIVKAFVWIVAGSIGIAGAGGLFLRMQLMRRVDAITRTCEAIIAGRYHERIPLSRRGDELERLSIAINEMLNRISALLDNLRQVSSDVAHDLKTPLTRLRNRLEEARVSARDSTDYAAAVTRAIGDTDQVLAIFSALLRISQIEAGTRAAGFAWLSLSELLENIVEMYRPVAEDNRQILVSNIEPQVRIRGDAELLTQLFSNLVENAIRHTPERTRIRVALNAAPDATVASVSDDGPGIPVQEHDKVLRRFYRLSAARSTAGHGLGLAMVAAIAGLHQATLLLKDSKPGLCVSARFY